MRDSQRIPELDSLRGIASLLVMIHHNLLASNLMVGPLFVLTSTPFSAIFTGRHAVMFFFVLSGFVLTRSLGRFGARSDWRDWIGWIAQRTVRLCLPGFVSLVISAFLYGAVYDGTWDSEGWWLSSTLWQSPPSVASIIEQGLGLRSTLRYEGNNVLWSLAHEWHISIFLPIVATIAWLRLRSSATAMLFLAIGLAGAAGGDKLTSIGVGAGAIDFLRSTAYFVLPFCFGVAIERLGLMEIRATMVQTVAAWIAAFGLCRFANDLSDYAFSVIMIWLAGQPGLFARVLRQPVLAWLGRVSFSLYLVHELVLAVLHHLLHGAVAPWLILVLSCCLALVAAQIFYSVIERRSHHLARWIQRSLRGQALPAVVPS